MLVAYLLWFFFGVFGIHRIYLGRWISGGIWFFTGGLFLVGFVVDAVLTYYIVKEENSIPMD